MEVFIEHQAINYICVHTTLITKMDPSYLNTVMKHLLVWEGIMALNLYY